VDPHQCIPTGEHQSKVRRAVRVYIIGNKARHIDARKSWKAGNSGLDEVIFS